MKKLMFVAATIAASVVVADVTSSNIVGYSGRETEENLAPIVGAMFVAVGGGETYDLSALSIPEIRDEEGELLDYLDAGTECIRVLDPNSSATTARYTYISAGYVEDNVGDVADYPDAIGWWNYEAGYDYVEAIADGDYSKKITGAVPIANGTAFLGDFSNGHSVSLRSNGEVVTIPSVFETAENLAPIFVNYLPVTIKLSDITIPELRDEEGEIEDYLDAGTECIRALDPNSSLTTARYTYISAGYIEDNVGDVADYLDAIGWWNYEAGFDYAGAIADGDLSKKVTEDVEVGAGDGFLGDFSNGHSMGIHFPSALAVPSLAD